MYWVADSQGRVLGPMQFETVAELVASGRFPDLVRVSRDGSSWVPAERVPEVAGLKPASQATQLTESEKAAKVNDYLERISKQPPHEVFRVPATATIADYRAAFFSTVKRFYPDQHPHGELRSACERVFLHLASLMLSLDNGAVPMAVNPRSAGGGFAASSALTPTPPITPRPPTASATPRPPNATLPRAHSRFSRQREAPTYEPAEFLGLRWTDSVVEARLRIHRKHLPMFTDHPLANFNAQSVFVPGSQVVPLGTLIDLTFEFQDPKGEVQTRGKVFWENSGTDPRQASGFGVRLFTLKPKDQEFIQAFIRGN